MMDPSRESGLGSDTDNMAELAALLNTEIPEGQNNLTDNYTNLERVAEYCEANYFQAENKRYALEETKNYTTQSLASVAYQINTLAYNFLQLLNLQSSQLEEMEAQMNHIQQTVMIHKEKVARREIGVLTASKTIIKQHQISAPQEPEKPIKYVRMPIDFNALDEIGHGYKSNTSRVTKSRTSSQSSMVMSGVGPAPTTKPPTPPSAIRSTGSLSKGSREYRTPPAVAPPQANAGSKASHRISKVPSHYAPNYPMGHARRQGGGYSTLPLASNPAHHSQPNTPPPPPSSNNINSYTLDHHTSMPPPPSPLTLAHGGMEPIDPRGGVMTLPHMARSSPPLPPPPAPIDQPPPPMFTPMPIVTDELDLPGWVPKNYIEKVVAIYDYYADKDDELSFQESAIIYVLKKNDDGWWEGVMDGITGLFPGNYVEPCA
ncbi:abl interactor 2 isoform X2 [Cimex lectularius]|nr:abl interactor 2 isoform X2 [Cimex lectularius]XP_014245956.1 abl interactor 2 isoform X2 [Cimex lectularius]